MGGTDPVDAGTGRRPIDYMALHRYAHLHNDAPFETFMAFAEDFNQHLTAYEGLIRSVCLERGISHPVNIAIDEWAVMAYAES